MKKFLTTILMVMFVSLAACGGGGGGGGSTADSGNTGGGDPTCLTANGLTCDDPVDGTIGLNWRDTTDASQRDPATGPEFTWNGKTYGLHWSGQYVSLNEASDTYIYPDVPTQVGDCIFIFAINKNTFATCGDVRMEFEWVVSGSPRITITTNSSSLSMTPGWKEVRSDGNRYHNAFKLVENGITILDQDVWFWDNDEELSNLSGLGLGDHIMAIAVTHHTGYVYSYRIVR